MALSASTVWEVRSTGSATNGGGFVAGASGTDWTQQNAAQYSVTDGVTAGTTTITSATANFGTDVVGNIMYVTGGTGSVAAAWYQIVSRTNSTTVVVDSSTGLTAGTGVTLKIGGALDGLGTLSGIMVFSNKAFVKTSGGFSATTTTTFSQSGTATNTATYTRLIGYTTTRGDAGKAVLTLSTNTGLTGISATGSSFSVENIAVNCSSLGTSTGFSMTGPFGEIRNCKVSNFTTAGISVGSSYPEFVDFCEVTGGTSAATAGILLNTSVYNVVNNCWIHDNACTGISSANEWGAIITYNLVTNNTGATSDGIIIQWGSVVINNTCYGNGRHGISQMLVYPLVLLVRNNLLVSNGGYGFVYASSAGSPAVAYADGNAYYNNTSGTINNYNDTGSVNPIDAVSPYTNVLDVILTADPFVASASDNYNLNATSGGGKSCNGFGVPTSWPGNSLTTSAPSMGAAQPASTSSGGLTGAAMLVRGYNFPVH